MNLSILNPNQNVFLQHYAEIAKKCEPIKDKLSLVGFKSDFLANAVQNEFKDKKDAVSVYFVLDYNSPYLVLSNRLPETKEDRSYYIEITDKASLVSAVKVKMQEKFFDFVNFEFLCEQLDKLDKNAKEIGITFAEEIKYFCLISEIDIMWNFLTHVTVSDRPEFIYTASQELRDKYEQDVHNALYGLSGYPTTFMKEYFAERGFDINNLESLQVEVPPAENLEGVIIELYLKMSSGQKEVIMDKFNRTILPKLGLDTDTKIRISGNAIRLNSCKLNTQAILNYKLILSLELRKMLNAGLIADGQVTVFGLSIDNSSSGAHFAPADYYQIDVYGEVYKSESFEELCKENKDHTTVRTLQGQFTNANGIEAPSWGSEE